MFPDMTATQTILLIVALEHIVLCVRFVITSVISDMPGWLATEMAKIEWARREAGRVAATATPSPDEAVAVGHKLIGRFSVSPSHSLATASSESKVSEVGPVPSPLAEPRSSTAPTSPGPGTAATSCSPVKTSPITISAESIQKIPPFRGGPRKSREWQPHEGEHHLTIGPSGGVEWARRLKEDGDIHHSSDCITTQNKDASSSDSDLLRGGSPLWPPMPRGSAPSGKVSFTRYHFLIGIVSGSNSSTSSPPAKREHHHVQQHQVQQHPVPQHHTHHSQQPQAQKQEQPQQTSTNSQQSKSSTSSEPKAETSTTSSGSSSHDDEAAAAARAAEELAAKKTRVKQSLMKRARSVAIFSLKLKERRAREAQERASKQAASPTAQLPPPQCGGGEMSCIPIEKVRIDAFSYRLYYHVDVSAHSTGGRSPQPPGPAAASATAEQRNVVAHGRRAIPPAIALVEQLIPSRTP